MGIMEDSKSFEILRNAFEQQLINDGFVEHSGYSLEKNHINAYIDERVECAWFACLQGYRLAKAQAVPDGYCVVPKEPTPKMSIAYQKNAIAPVSSLSISGYKAMIEAQEQK